MPDIERRNKTAGNDVEFENVGDPLGVTLVGFLAADSLDILRVSKDNVARLFEDVVDGNPVFTGGFHTDIAAIVFRKPGGK